MQNILATGASSVPLNDVPGKDFKCKVAVVVGGGGGEGVGKVINYFIVCAGS